MHPIFGQSSRLRIYLSIWLPVALLLAAVVAQRADVGWPLAVGLSLPLSLVYAFVCLAAWFPSRATPLSQGNTWRVVSTHGLAAWLSSAVWQLTGMVWASALGRVPYFAGAPAAYRQQALMFFVVGLLLYGLAAITCYLYLAFQASREAETRALVAQKNQEIAARELELARGIQKRLLPAGSHRGDGFRLAARNLAADLVAGDFYDYYQLDDGKLRIAVADVAGKGVAASLITATVKAVLPLLAADRTVTETMDELNRRLASHLARREFVALLLASYDPARRSLEVANAGLPDPYILRGDEVEALEAPQPRLPLGLRPGQSYGSVQIELQEGERVLFLTDGLPEALTPVGEPLGYEALEQMLRHHDPEPGAWLDRLLERLGEVTSESPGDDWTAVLLETAPVGALPGS